MDDDLISREKALEVVKRHMCDSARIEQGILELQTAYSIDKVVKQINEERGMERLTNAGTKEAKASITIREVTNKLAEYEDLEEQGLLLRLPCKVGGRVYYYHEEIEEVFPIEISTIHISDMGNGEKVFQFDGAFYNSDGDVEFDYEFDLEEFGETIFLTMEEAEKELKNRKCEEMQWLTWKNVKEWGEIQCPMLGDKCVMTYYREDEPCYYSYTAPFVQDGEIYYYRFDHDEGCWDESTYCIGEYREGDWG